VPVLEWRADVGDAHYLDQLTGLVVPRDARTEPDGTAAAASLLPNAS
jgi:hypothetical protein